MAYPDIPVKVGGAWVGSKPWVKVSGVWQACTEVWVKVAGVWQQAFAAAVAAVFTPDGGNNDNGARIEDLACNQPAVWTWTRTSGTGGADVANGGTATTIRFSVPIAGPGAVNQGIFTVSGVAAGVTRNFTVTVISDNR